GETAPWYMPTFNHDNLDLRTAAAGHARDYIAGAGATDGTTDGATHPGDGTDAYWSENDTFDNSAGIWPGATLENEAAQNLRQQRAPMTIEQWSNLLPYQQIGDFWVVDHTTGWAYWASLLEPGNASSYLLDAAELTDAIEDTVFNGSYYYGIHVDSQLISPDNSEEFLPGGDSRLEAFLTGIKNNSMNDEGTTNPRAEVDSSPSALNFDTMLPGRVFTMSGEQYRYLEDQGAGNHLIIRHDMLPNTTFANQNTVLETWYGQLDSAVQAIVQPVYNEFTTGTLLLENASIDDYGFLITNLDSNPAVAADVTRLTQGAGSSPRAFALSLADVNRLSGEGLAFSNHEERRAAGGAWWTRTPGGFGVRAWVVWTGGGIANVYGLNVHEYRGVRPALIVHQ
ncbi:hypothetical protein, partial [Lactococcus garvieae]|uniref:hypothetical protein n=1 Tax=Lactococcus garvieae TaxID=1363 RepID=UPI003852A152